MLLQHAKDNEPWMVSFVGCHGVQNRIPSIVLISEIPVLQTFCMGLVILASNCNGCTDSRIEIENLVIWLPLQKLTTGELGCIRGYAEDGKDCSQGGNAQGFGNEHKRGILID